MEHASVVIVGGWVIGASIAFHLAEAGVVDVLLVERAELGSGSTSKGAGGVRAMFSDALNVRIGLRSLEAWGAFGERPGWEIDLAVSAICSCYRAAPRWRSSSAASKCRTSLASLAGC